VAVRAEAAALLALTLVLAGVLLAVRPAGRASRTVTQVLGAIPVAAVALSIVTAASGSPDPLVLILLLGCVITVLLLARAQARRLSRHMQAVHDNLRRARLNRQRRLAPRVSTPASPVPASPEARPEPR
jgi:ABC-type nitrate/sulfonate/bicarbonate transport system permease component